MDAAGNVYIADTGDNAIKEWNASTQTVSTLASSGLSGPRGVAVDAAGNVYVADTGNHAIEEIPRAFVSAAAIREGAAAGSDALPPVLPAGARLAGVFAPASDQSWLTIGSVAGGVVNFSFTGDTGAARTAHITLLGRQVPVTQATGSAPAGNLGAFSGGYWYLDTSGTGQWTASDSVVAFNEPGATPVVGDWDGSGHTELGFFDSSTATWWLDTASGVETFQFGFPSSPGNTVIPVVGDWNGAPSGSGKTEVGVYCNGAWFRNVNGSHTWDAANQADLAYLGWNDGGTNTVVPVPGNWAGDGKTEMGVYCQGVWFLDSTGSGKWDGSFSYWGWSGSLIPVVGNWSSGGNKDQFGVYNQGVWFRDADGTHQWDAANQAALAYLGWSGALPVVGNWPGSTQPAAAVRGAMASPASAPALLQPVVTAAVQSAVQEGVVSSLLVSLQQASVLAVDPLGAQTVQEAGDEVQPASGAAESPSPTNAPASSAPALPSVQLSALDPMAVDAIDLATIARQQLGAAYLLDVTGFAGKNPCP